MGILSLISRVNTKDDYISLPSKVIAAFGAIRQTFKFKYVFKTDDDQDLINEKFFDTIVVDSDPTAVHRKELRNRPLKLHFY